ncbi:MAG: Fic family protein [Candidatus Woesearchaeota archaeon]
MAMEERLQNRILRKKKALDSLRPINKGALVKLQETFRIDLTYNSNAIEGNSLSLSETKIILEEGLTIGGKSMKEHLEATNHSQAINMVDSLVHKKTITELDVLNLHAIILDRIDPNNAGFYRHGAVRISGTTYSPPNPAKVPELMKEVYALLNTRGEPIEIAAQAHQRFVDIHPFIDGNGRTARLLLNLYLMRSGYPPVIILRAERVQYIRAIMQSRSENDILPFANFVARALERSLDIYINTLGDMPEEYMTLAEASRQSKNNYSAEYLGLLARRGLIGAVKFGRNWVLTMKELNEYEEEHKKKQQTNYRKSA